MANKWKVFLAVMLVFGTSLFPLADSHSNNSIEEISGTILEHHVEKDGVIVETLDSKKVSSLYTDLSKASTIPQQFDLLKKYNIIPQNATLPEVNSSAGYGGPYLFSFFSFGIGLPPIPLPVILAYYGYVLHPLPLILFMLAPMLKLVNLVIPPPFPEISTGYIYTSDFSKYYTHIISPKDNHEEKGFGATTLLVFGFIGWKIYIPLVFNTGVELEIFNNIYIPIPLALTIFIGAAAYANCLCFR